MSAYTSLKLTKGKAREIVQRHIELATDDQLRHLVSHILQIDTLYNCYALVENNEESDDERVNYDWR